MNGFSGVFCAAALCVLFACDVKNSDPQAAQPEDPKRVMTDFLAGIKTGNAEAVFDRIDVEALCERQLHEQNLDRAEFLSQKAKLRENLPLMRENLKKTCIHFQNMQYEVFAPVENPDGTFDVTTKFSRDAEPPVQVTWVLKDRNGRLMIVFIKDTKKPEPKYVPVPVR